ncbi:MAG: 4-hydroxy-tetrahydrodipicolinate reductase [Actinobacteria bacterium]|nr:4-hydroxy-tetrahydrodipicolinate reductase [Actinomycetota bacterium]
MVKVAVSGALGSMGKFTCAAVLQDAGLALVAAVDPRYAETDDSFPDYCPHFVTVESALGAVEVDVLVDFTQPAVVLANVLAALQRRVAPVVGTTGLSDESLSRIAAECRRQDTPTFVAPNFALGAILMMQFAREAAQHLDACEIVELHHTGKLDAPSGTAKRTAGLVEEEWGKRSHQAQVPVHSVRLPGLVAHQEVIFGGLGETLTIRHDSLSRESFMPGVVLAVKRVRNLQGLVVGLENII